LAREVLHIANGLRAGFLPPARRHEFGADGLAGQRRRRRRCAGNDGRMRALIFTEARRHRHSRQLIVAARVVEIRKSPCRRRQPHRRLLDQPDVSPGCPIRIAFRFVCSCGARADPDV